MELLVLDRTSAAFSDVASVSTAAVKRSPSANFQSTSSLISIGDVLSVPSLIFEKVSDLFRGFSSFFDDFSDNPEQFLQKFARDPAKHWLKFFDEFYNSPSKLFGDFNAGIKAYSKAYLNFKHGVACLPYLGNEQFLKMFKEQNAILQIRDFNKRSLAQAKFDTKYAAELIDFDIYSDEAETVSKMISPIAMYKELEFRIAILKSSREVIELLGDGGDVEEDRKDEFLISNKEFRALVIEKVFQPFFMLKIWRIEEKFKFVHEFLAKSHALFTKPENAEKADKWVEQFLRFSMVFSSIVEDAQENGIPGFGEEPGRA
ncbi:MAG TPA: hypothetical protein VLG76_08905 [Rhabdochlamydiaceae bacterium]|nr:hypothetical protein [Rhabdochlamydiaceae bacterium]